MNTTQQTTEAATMTIEQIEAIVTEIAEANAFDYAGNYGRGTFRFAVKARLSGGVLTLSAVVNACIKIETARAELSKVWTELLARIESNGSSSMFCMPRHNKANVWRQGFWHMGHFCTEGIARQIKTK